MVAAWRSPTTKTIEEGFAEPAHGGESPIDLNKAITRLGEQLVAAREILLEVGAHGDLRLGYRIHKASDRILYDLGRALAMPGPNEVQVWTTLDPEEPNDTVLAEIALEIRRTLGVSRPPAVEG